MKVSEALNYAKSATGQDGSGCIIRALRTLADEVERLSTPCSIDNAPGFGDIYIVTSSEPLVDGRRAPGGTLRTRLGCTPKYPSVHKPGVLFEPLAWWPVPTTTEDQLNRMTGK